MTSLELIGAALIVAGCVLAFIAIFWMAPQIDLAELCHGSNRYADDQPRSPGAVELAQR